MIKNNRDSRKRGLTKNMEKNMRKYTYAVTGAGGYLGTHIVNSMRSKGYTVYEMSRPKTTVIGDKYHLDFILGTAVNRDKLKNIDVLIHCAYDFTLRNKEDIQKINVDGSIRLLRAAKEAGVKKIIVISSVAAFEDAKSMYGKAKFAIEKEASNLDAFIIRPGLIFSKNPGGMIGSLRKMVSISRIIPIVGLGNQKFYLCHVNDLASLVFKLSIIKGSISNPIYAGLDKKITFKEIIRILAKVQNKTILLVPVPYTVLFSMLRFAELVGLKIGLRSDSLRGLVNRNRNIDFTETRKLGIVFREFNNETADE